MSTALPADCLLDSPKKFGAGRCCSGCTRYDSCPLIAKSEKVFTGHDELCQICCLRYSTSPWQSSPEANHPVQICHRWRRTHLPCSRYPFLPLQFVFKVAIHLHRHHPSRSCLESAARGQTFVHRHQPNLFDSFRWERSRSIESWRFPAWVSGFYWTAKNAAAIPHLFVDFGYRPSQWGCCSILCFCWFPLFVHCYWHFVDLRDLRVPDYRGHALISSQMTESPTN